METICVLFGGVSSEHEVSLRSATTVLNNIPLDQYNVVQIGITREGRWLYYPGDTAGIIGDTWHQGNLAPALISPDRTAPGVLLLEKGGVRHISVDVVFPVLHGKNGEDGTVQGMLAMSGIPCVGCGTLSSALCMDKAIAHVVLQAAGIPKTDLIALQKQDMKDMAALEARLKEALGYPMFVKPANSGSSVGVTRVNCAQELEAALEAALVHDSKVVVERMMVGQEVECAVMGNQAPIASDVLGEIVPPDGVYDYESKYLNDSAGLYIPAHVSEEVVREIRELAVKGYQALDCRGFARVDFFVTKDRGVILNEINTIPGFTSISMFPKLFEASGVPISETVHRLITYALER